MLRPENQTDHLLRRLATEDYHILFSWDPRFDPIWVADYWRWVGVVSAHTYTLGASPQDLRAPPIMTTDNTSEIDALSRGGATSLLAAPLHVPCDTAGHLVPAGARGTWLRVRADPNARIWPSLVLAPVPARQVLVLAPLITFGLPTASISCAGAGEIVIDGAYDAPPPG